MSAATKIWTPPVSYPAPLRPFDVRRDLARVADLVEVCFSDTLDRDGERYLRQMRSASQNSSYMRWASLTSEWASVPLSGFVWEEDGQLVGNASLIPYHLHGRRHFLIANVAVHPDYQRRGIGRHLTQRAMDQARQRGVKSVWLHVRENNDTAVNLYRSLGFLERARRTTWTSPANFPFDLAPPALPPGIRIGGRSARHWGIQREWLSQTYPANLTWHLPLDLNALRPGLFGGLYRLAINADTRQWSVLHNAQPLAFLSWQEAASNSQYLWLAAPPSTDPLIIRALLIHARRRLPAHRGLSLDYPARQLVDAIQAAGFVEHQTLIWMEAVF
jgi:ribosomal protein S18 acetylase RimI-like enzyme